MSLIYALLIVTTVASHDGERHSSEYYPLTGNLTYEQCIKSLDEHVYSSVTGPLLMARIVAAQSIYFEAFKQYPAKIEAKFVCKEHHQRNP